MQKRILIISPHFPPINAPDMQRVRMSLPYYKELGWEVEIICVDEQYVEGYRDDILLETVPADIIVHKVKAWPVSLTRKLGLGSLSMRSFFQYRKKGNALLSSGKFDLVFFSTTAFHVMALGPYWKKKYKVPFVLDMQDPWRNDFYLDKPKHERPPKFFISYNIDKYLEARTVPFADAIISVSKAYCDTFKIRYKNFKDSTCTVIPFGALSQDFIIMEQHRVKAEKIQFDEQKINVVYVGRGGHDMKFALQLFFKTLAIGLKQRNDLFKNIHCWFVGTSYAIEGKGTKTIEPIAESENVKEFVTEITDRIPYFETLALLKKATILFIPGSTDTGYTASKIYPYILAKKPLLACFHKDSSVVDILHQSKVGQLVTFENEDVSTGTLVKEMYEKLCYLLVHKDDQHQYDLTGFSPYTAEEMTRKLVAVFNDVIKRD